MGESISQEDFRSKSSYTGPCRLEFELYAEAEEPAWWFRVQGYSWLVETPRPCTPY